MALTEAERLIFNKKSIISQLIPNFCLQLSFNLIETKIDLYTNAKHGKTVSYCTVEMHVYFN